jgi:hypothetical protein
MNEINHFIQVELISKKVCINVWMILALMHLDFCVIEKELIQSII